MQGDDGIRKFAALVIAGALALLCAACSDGKVPSSATDLPHTSSSSAALPPSSADTGQPLPQNGLPAGVPGLNPLTGLPLPEGASHESRPVAIMVDNTLPALPQSGLAAADVLVEAAVEGGASRLMALYSSYPNVPMVGPVRGTADQFLQLILPLNAIPVHIGGTQPARNLLYVLGYAAVDGMDVGVTAFDFITDRHLPKDEGKNNEFCWFTVGRLIGDGMQAAEIGGEGAVPQMFHFSPAAAQAGSDAWHIAAYPADDSGASFDFDEASGLYLKNLFGAPHTDMDGAHLAFTNVLVLECDITGKEDAPQMPEFDLRSGTGSYFALGQHQPLRWEKGGPTDPLLLYAEDGRPLQVLPGKTYVVLVPRNTEAPCYTYAPRPE